jgi:uncharacterized protein YbjQ (UPF0145 family)
MDMAIMECDFCNKVGDKNDFSKIDDKDACYECQNKYVIDKTNNIIVTTTPSIDGYKTVNYIGIDSVEIVIGTGLFSEISTSIEDMFGLRSTAFEQKLQDAKQAALTKLKYIAWKKSGNAVLSVTLNYTEFDKNRVGLIICGTIVKVEKVE